MWCTHSPCRKCAQLLANAGIKDIHWHYVYNTEALNYLFSLGVKGNRQLIPGVPPGE